MDGSVLLVFAKIIAVKVSKFSIPLGMFLIIIKLHSYIAGYLMLYLCVSHKCIAIGINCIFFNSILKP